MKWQNHADLAADLGAAVRERRTALGLSQEHVAHEAGLSVRHYAKIEKGTENATIASLFNIATVLDLNFFDLVRLASKRRTRRR